MKTKFFYLILMAMTLSLTFVACDKDDDDDDESGGNIVGRWECNDLKIVDFKVNNQSVSSAQLKQLENSLKEGFDEVPFYGAVLEFASDGKVYTSGESGYATYTVKGRTLTITEGVESISFAYSVTGNQLQLNVDLFQDPDAAKELQSAGITAYVVGLIFVREEKESKPLKSQYLQNYEYPSFKNLMQRLAGAVI